MSTTSEMPQTLDLRLDEPEGARLALMRRNAAQRTTGEHRSTQIAVEASELIGVGPANVSAVQRRAAKRPVRC